MAQEPPKAAPVRVFRISGAECLPVEYDGEESLLAQGGTPWTGNDVVTMPDGMRAVFYPKGHPNPWPLNAPPSTRPNNFTETDLRKMFGAYMVWLAEQALRPPEPESRFTLADIIIIVLGGINVVLGGFAIYYAWKALDAIRAATG